MTDSLQWRQRELPSPESVRATILSAQTILRQAGHKGCGLSRDQHALILAQLDKLNAIADFLQDRRDNDKS
jgi:hypothetical protein